MPPKVRGLIADLLKSGFVDGGGRGSHRNYVHPLMRNPVEDQCYVGSTNGCAIISFMAQRFAGPRVRGAENLCSDGQRRDEKHAE